MNNEMNPITGNNIFWEQAQEKKRLLQEKKEKKEKILNKCKQKLGKIGTIKTIDGLIIEVIAKDFKQSFGHFRYLISPVSGSGEIWTEKIVF